MLQGRVPRRRYGIAQPAPVAQYRVRVPAAGRTVGLRRSRQGSPKSSARYALVHVEARIWIPADLDPSSKNASGFARIWIRYPPRIWIPSWVRYVSRQFLQN